MKRKILLLFIGLLSISGYSQDWSWSKHIRGNWNDESNSIAVDNIGNIYIAGEFESSLLYFDTDTLQNNGVDDMFITKYDPNGNEVWSRKLGGNNYDPSSDLETIGGIRFDSLDNTLLVCGAFYGEIHPGDTIIYGTGLDAFVLKMNLDGEYLWCRSGGSNWEDRAYDVTYDPLGNVYISGTNLETANFGTQEIDPGGFIAKYSSIGDLAWVKKKFRLTGNSVNRFCEARPDNLNILNDNLYIFGKIANDTVIIEDSTFLLPHAYASSYIGLFSETGDLQWMKFFGKPLAEPSLSISFLNQFSLFSTGTFVGSSIFGTDTLIGAENGDAYIIKHDLNGDINWIRQTHSSYYAMGQSIAEDLDGGVYMGGSFGDTTQFGNETLISIGVTDTYVAHYNSNGDLLGVIRFPDGDVIANAVDNQGNLISVGTFQNTSTIGPNTFTSIGGTDIFIAKCSPITSIPELQKSTGNELVIYANPNTGKCNITIPEEFENEQHLILRIYDSNGKLIQEKDLELREGKIKVDIAREAKGVYAVTLSNGKKSYSGRIVFM